ncbi:hypothetical protein ACFQAT_08500 [Undibacterium arcticum]|uniref:hypothetical protein n=1 Tax=Undibacterium arcticum TaxID=1762892 RepID=UPI003610CBAD
MEWLLKAVKKGHALASVALGRIKRAAIAGSVDFQEAEDLFRIALVDANVARLELAELYTLHSEAPQHRLDAASLLQQCYEFALEEDDKELAELCKLKSPAAVAELVRALPRMDTTMRKSAVFVTNFFTANGQPHRRRSDQIEAFWVKARAFTDIAQQASAANRTAAPALPFSPERSGPQTPGANSQSKDARGKTSFGAGGEARTETRTQRLLRMWLSKEAQSMLRPMIEPARRDRSLRQRSAG